MKKLLLVILALVCLTLPALAEAQNAPLGVDWTRVIVWFIGAVGAALSAFLARIWTVHVRPWLEQRGMMEAAQIVVDAVEALHGRYCTEESCWLSSEEKWRAALVKMMDRGYDIDSNAVIDALKAAWQQLNLAQIAAGVKGAVVCGEVAEAIPLETVTVTVDVGIDE